MTRITAVIIAGEEHEYLSRILEQWMDEEFVTEDSPLYGYAMQLHEQIDERLA